MTKNERYMYQAYLLLLRRTLELADEETVYRLETDRLWKFYKSMAIEYKERNEADKKPN